MDLTEERHFVLRVIKYECSLYNQALPDDVQKMLNEFPGEEYRNFTLNMRQALIHLGAHISRLCETHLDLDYVRNGIDNVYFGLQELLVTYNSRKFLEFCAWHGGNAAKYYGRNKISIPLLEFYESCMKILYRAKEAGLFTEDSWHSLEQAALEIIEEARIREHFAAIPEPPNPNQDSDSNKSKSKSCNNSCC